MFLLFAIDPELHVLVSALSSGVVVPAGHLCCVIRLGALTDQ
jgi:hypothetical protein